MTIFKNIYDSWYKFVLNALMELSVLVLACSLFFFEFIADEKVALEVGRYLIIFATVVQLIGTGISLAEMVHNLVLCLKKKKE